MPLEAKRLNHLRRYIESRYVEELSAVSLELSRLSDVEEEPFDSLPSDRKKKLEYGKGVSAPAPPPRRNLGDVVDNPEESFSRALFRLIREKGADEVETYKLAGLDRKHFSKIRSNDDYRPRKSTALSLSLALELNLDETLDLLGRAGYTLSHASKADLIVEYFITEEIWGLPDINEALAEYEQPLLNTG